MADRQASDELVAVGRITRAHGVHGEVSVLPLTEVTERFAPGSSLLLEDEDRRLIVASSRPNRDRVLVRFEGIADRTEAEKLRDRVLLAEAATSPPLESGTFWVHEVVGLEVVTEDGRSLGRIREVLLNPANDVWVADADGREVLIPAIRDVVREVDLEAGRIVIHLLPGLEQ